MCYYTEKFDSSKNPEQWPFSKKRLDTAKDSDGHACFFAVIIENGRTESRVHILVAVNIKGSMLCVVMGFISYYSLRFTLFTRIAPMIDERVQLLESSAVAMAETGEGVGL